MYPKINLLAKKVKRFTNPFSYASPIEKVAKSRNVLLLTFLIASLKKSPPSNSP